MHPHSHSVLAASGSTSLALIIVGIVVVLGLLAMFVAGRRRAARRTRSTPAHGGRPPGAETQRGDTWQTPDDDPDQGNPHR
ncbi:DUF6479 family protein [Streptomyces flavofungini]|uniref:DUF6479 family protein n=1 Tax=Streptomyces flavofungini TaxID=68200 RepID=UPI0025B18F6B|nr:DUF6479 family protein [Streptomyces flavofungini]WJV50536.1 DUF6479 family protein [Streptomyces flavofungini]